MSSANAFSLDRSKNLWFGKGLTNLRRKASENIERKRENKISFCSFTTMFSNLLKTEIVILDIFIVNPA